MVVIGSTSKALWLRALHGDRYKYWPVFHDHEMRARTVLFMLIFLFSAYGHNELNGEEYH
jgi:hypothetical protein